MRAQTLRQSCTAAVTFALAMVLTVVIPTRPVSAARVTGDPLAPQAGALLGAHVQDAAGNVGQEAVTAFESLIGRTLAIDHYYRPWTTTFPTGREQWDFDHGRIPMISWGKASTAEILAGVHDDLIRQRSAAVAALGRPVFLRWFWEMDGHNNGNGASFLVTPAEYIRAWRHIHDLFAAQGATNAVWVWCPNAWNFETGNSQQYYPGDAYVDWICADGYNWFPIKPGAPDQSFQRIFQAFYDWAGPQGKPLMVGEW